MKYFLMIFVSGLNLSFAAANETLAPEFYCKSDYVAEAHRLKDLNDNGQEAKNARMVLEARSKRMDKGALIGMIATSALVLPFAGKISEGEKFDWWAAAYGALASTGPGYFAGSRVGERAASKPTKESEKQAQWFLKELQRVYDGTVAAYKIVYSAVIVNEREKYLPEEVMEHTNNISWFLRKFNVKDSLGEPIGVTAAVAKIIEGDSNKTICPAEMPPFTDEQIARWLEIP